MKQDTGNIYIYVALKWY